MIEIESKIQKIVTALYLISDLIYDEDPLRKDIRHLSVSLGSLIGSLAIEAPSQAKKSITEAQNYIDRIQNVLKVCVSVGFVSDMNFKIVSNHLIFLKDDLNKKYALINSQSLAASSFHNKAIHEFVLPDFIVKDNSQKNTVEVKTNKAFKQQISSGSTPHTPKKDIQEKNIKDIKMEQHSFGQRVERIIDIIRQKGEVSVSDVSTQFPELSEKTIQRILIRLVEQGSLVKTGEKRWSRYSIPTIQQ